MESTSGVDAPCDPTAAEHSAPPAQPSVRWTVADEFAGKVEPARLLQRIDSPDDPRIQTVKRNPRRRILRLDSDDASFYVKEYRSSSLRARLRRILRGPEALREWRIGRRAEQRGIPCVRHVAVASGTTRSLLVTLESPGATSLSEAWQGTVADTRRDRRGRCELIHAMAALLAAAHQRGFTHGDDHPRNILIAPATGGRAGAHYLDLYSGRFYRTVPESAVTRSLAQLNQWFRLRASRLERTRFLRAYCARRHPGSRRAARELFARLAPTVAAESDRRALQLWRKRDRRILGTNAYFAHLNLTDGSVAHVTLRTRSRDLFSCGTVPDRTAEQWRARLESPPKGRVQFEVTTHADIVEARQRFVSAHRLRNRDIHCRCPSAFIETRDHTGRRTAQLIWEEPAAARSLLALWAAADRLAKRTQLCIRLAELLNRLSSRGVSLSLLRHDTIAATNAGNLYINDAQGLFLRTHDRQRDRLESARAVAASDAAAGRTDGVRFLRALDPSGWKALLRRLPNLHRGDTNDA